MLRERRQWIREKRWQPRNATKVDIHRLRMDFLSRIFFSLQKRTAARRTKMCALTCFCRPFYLSPKFVTFCMNLDHAFALPMRRFPCVQLSPICTHVARLLDSFLVSEYSVPCRIVKDHRTNQALFIEIRDNLRPVTTSSLFRSSSHHQRRTDILFLALSGVAWPSLPPRAPKSGNTQRTDTLS